MHHTLCHTSILYRGIEYSINIAVFSRNVLVLGLKNSDQHRDQFCLFQRGL